VALCFGAGILLVAVAIPLWLRRIPPNHFYGARFRSTLADDAVWYEINERAGRNLVGIGCGYLLFLALAVNFGDRSSRPISILVPTVLLVIALIVNTFLLNAAARELAVTSINADPH
jgi:uncharacterized membrane protein